MTYTKPNLQQPVTGLHTCVVGFRYGVAATWLLPIHMRSRSV